METSIFILIKVEEKIVYRCIDISVVVKKNPCSCLWVDNLTIGNSKLFYGSTDRSIDITIGNKVPQSACVGWFYYFMGKNVGWIFREEGLSKFRAEIAVCESYREGKIVECSDEELFIVVWEEF